MLKCSKYMKPRSTIQKSTESATIPHNIESRGFEDYKVHGQCFIYQLILLGFVINYYYGFTKVSHPSTPNLLC